MIIKDEVCCTSVDEVALCTQRNECSSETKMANMNINERPNLKICIDNTEEGSESDNEVRLEEDAGDVIVTGDSGSESDAGESYTESGGKLDRSESSAAEDDEIERAILEANIPPEELRELSPEPLPVPVSISYHLSNEFANVRIQRQIF